MPDHTTILGNRAVKIPHNYCHSKFFYVARFYVVASSFNLSLPLSQPMDQHCGRNAIVQQECLHPRPEDMVLSIWGGKCS